MDTQKCGIGAVTAPEAPVVTMTTDATYTGLHYRPITLAEAPLIIKDALYVGFPLNQFYKIDKIDYAVTGAAPGAILRYTDAKGSPSACEIDADGRSVYFGTQRLFALESPSILPDPDYSDWMNPPAEAPKCNSSEPEPEPAAKSITDITRGFCR